MSDKLHQSPDRYAIKDGESVSGKYPRYEIKLRYDCNLCKLAHTALIKVKGGADSDLGKVYLDMAKKDLLSEFFTSHPNAKIKDFDSKGLSLKAKTHYSEDEVEEDKPRTVDISESLIKDFLKEQELREIEKIKKEEKKEVVLKENIEKTEEKMPSSKVLSVPPDNLGINFDGVEGMVRKKLMELTKNEQELEAKLLLIKQEKKKFETMVSAVDSISGDKEE